MKRKLGFVEAELKFYIAEIIIALELIHNNNVIYRDLKPENVMIAGDGHIKFVDFGFTKKLNDIHKDMTYTTWGTQAYISPEILLGIGHSYKTDIWSLGVLIWEIWGGFAPFMDSNPQKMNN